MQTEITAITPSSIKEYAEAFGKMAEMLVGGNSLPKAIKTKSDLVMYMQASKDLGLTLTESFNSLAFINGRMSMYGPKVIARARQAGYKFKFNEWFETVENSDGTTGRNLYCSCTMWHIDDKEDTRTERWDLLKAHKAGLLWKDVRKNYPETMLRYRAVNECIKFFAPDVLAGVAMYEEVKDITPDYIDGNSNSDNAWTIINVDQVAWNWTMDWFSDFVEWEKEIIINENSGGADETKIKPFEVGDIVKYKKKEYSIEEIMDDKVMLYSEDGEAITINLSDVKPL